MVENKTMPIKALYFDNILIAEGVVSKEGNYGLKLVEGVPDILVPKDLFAGDNCCYYSDISIWVEDRVPPPNREGLKKMLKELGLRGYDPYQIALHTRASLVEDGWWLKVEDTDTFRENSVRGRLNFPELDLSEVFKKE